MRGKNARELPAQPLRSAGDQNDFLADVEQTGHEQLREMRDRIDTDDFRDRKPPISGLISAFGVG
jgi:hypothetical protein